MVTAPSLRIVTIWSTILGWLSIEFDDLSEQAHLLAELHGRKHDDEPRVRPELGVKTPEVARIVCNEDVLALESPCGDHAIGRASETEPKNMLGLIPMLFRHRQQTPRQALVN